MTKFQLMSLLFKSGHATFTYKGEKLSLLSVERESGSGNSFNLTVMMESGEYKKIYIRTID